MIKLMYYCNLNEFFFIKYIIMKLGLFQGVGNYDKFIDDIIYIILLLVFIRKSFFI